MKTKKVTKDIFVSEDGKEFLNQKDCEFYEENTLGRFKKIQYFIIRHSADFTEGRGFQSSSLLAVESDYYHVEFVEMYCQIKFGKRIDWMYQTPAQVWSYYMINEKDYHSGTPKYGDKIFLSHSDLEGFPKHISLDKNTKKEEL